MVLKIKTIFTNVTFQSKPFSSLINFSFDNAERMHVKEHTYHLCHPKKHNLWELKLKKYLINCFQILSKISEEENKIFFEFHAISNGAKNRSLPTTAVILAYSVDET